MRIIKLPLEEFISNIREDKTIYLGLRTQIVCIDDRIDYSFMKKNYVLEENFDFNASIFLGKISFDNHKILFDPFELSSQSFEELNSFWLNEINPETHHIYYYKNPNNIKLNQEQIQSYFTNLYHNNIQFLSNYCTDINQLGGIKLYHLKQEQTHQKTNTKQLHGTEILPIEDEIFYSYLVWTLQNFLIPYDIGKYQEEHDFFFNLGAYKKYKNALDNGEIFIETTNSLNENHLDLFFDNINPLQYAIGYLQKKIGIYGKSLKSSLGTRHKHYSDGLNHYFELQENPDLFARLIAVSHPKKGELDLWSNAMLQKAQLKFLF